MNSGKILEFSDLSESGKTFSEILTHSEQFKKPFFLCQWQASVFANVQVFKLV
jgi:hypothetical protein